MSLNSQSIKSFARRGTWVCALALIAICQFGADAGEKNKPKDNGVKLYDMMDYGPYLSASIMSDPSPEFDAITGNFTLNNKQTRCDVSPRGFAIRLKKDWTAGIVFEADSMRMTAGWIGSPLKFKGLIGDGAHGPGPSLGSKPVFVTPFAPGWADMNGSFKEPRVDSIPPLPPPGNLPADWAKYKGLYLNGERVILSYTVGSTPVLESPSLEDAGEIKAFVRTITVGASEVPQALMVFEALDQHEEKKVETVEVEKTVTKDGKKVTEKVKQDKTTIKVTETPSKGNIENGLAFTSKLIAGTVNAPEGAAFEFADGQLHLKLPARKEPVTFALVIAGGGESIKAGFDTLVKASKKPADLTPLTKGGPPRWTETVETKGELAKDDSESSDKATVAEAYVSDRLTVPYKNPYNSWMRIGAMDFFKDGKSAAVSTWSGDVWIVSGIDEKLEKLTWKRFATGLHQPLGLKIVDETIYVVGHDQITRLHDLNNDGEADFYECFNNNWELTTAFHAFGFDLHTDPNGDFLFAFGSPVRNGGRGFQNLTKDHGTIIKVSKDGTKKETYATGVRAPNGMCVSPTGQVTIGDNEGTWVPTSPLHWVKPGAFLGMVDSAHGAKVEQPKPLVWLSKAANEDNSCGGQVWVTSDKWGPYKGELLHMSYGQSALYLVMKQEVNGQMQGGAVKIPVKFTSSAMRARFNPADGQLYIVGLRGWQTNASNDGGFDRIRYTGKTVHLPAALKYTAKGAYVTFATKLDPAYAEDVQNYAASMWNYKWTSDYGSPEVSVSNPDKKGHDPLEVKSAKLQDDGKTVFLEIPGIRPAMQIKLTSKLKAADGVDMKHDIYGTIYNLPAE